MAEQYPSNQRLFSHHAMVAELVRDCVREDFSRGAGLRYSGAGPS